VLSISSSTLPGSPLSDLEKDKKNNGNDPNSIFDIWIYGKINGSNPNRTDPTIPKNASLGSI
jgi:hypothetical protein